MDWGIESLPELAPPSYPLQPSAPACPCQWPDALQIEWVEPCMCGAEQTKCEIRYSQSAEMSEIVQVPESDIAKAIETKTLVIKDLQYTTEYFFQWRLANKVGWSPWSPVSPAFLTKETRPAAPGGLWAEEITMEGMTWCWSVPSDHGAAIDGYDIILVDSFQGLYAQGFEEVIKRANECNYPQEGEEFDAESADAAVWRVLQVDKLKDRKKKDVQDPKDPAASKHRFEGLLGGLGYMAVVRARNRCGWSDWSAMTFAKTPNSEPEQCPQALLLESNQTSVSVQFRMPYDNGAAITGMEFMWERLTGPKDRHKARLLGGRAEDHRYSASMTFFKDLSEGGPEAAPPGGIGGSGEMTLDGMEPGTEYDVKYRAENQKGFGPMSHVTRVLTAPGRPDVPGKVRHSQAVDRSESPDSPGLHQVLDDGTPPTVCFARTSRLQANEVVHVRQGRVKACPALPSSPGDTSTTAAKINDSPR